METIRNLIVMAHHMAVMGVPPECRKGTLGFSDSDARAMKRLVAAIDRSQPLPREQFERDAAWGTAYMAATRNDPLMLASDRSNETDRMYVDGIRRLIVRTTVLMRVHDAFRFE